MKLPIHAATSDHSKAICIWEANRLPSRLEFVRHALPVGPLFAKSGRVFRYEDFEKLVKTEAPAYRHCTFDLDLHDLSKRLKRITFTNSPPIIELG